MSIDGRVNAAWDRVEAWLGAHCPVVLRSLRPGATPAALAAAERALKGTFPADVRASILRHDGQREIAGLRRFLGDLPPLLPLHEMAQDDADWAALENDLRDAPVDAEAGVRPERFEATRLPFARSGSDRVTIDLDPAKGGVRGQLVGLSHDAEGVPVLAPSWVEWLERFADDLAAGRYPVGRAGLESRTGGRPFFKRGRSVAPNADILPPIEARWPDLAGRQPGPRGSPPFAEAVDTPELATWSVDDLPEVIPPEVGRLLWVQLLNVGGTQVPPEVGYLRRLAYFSADKLRTLPLAFAGAGADAKEGLSVDLRGSPLETVPEALSGMRHLTRLNLRRCRLGPTLRFGDWPALEELDLSENDLLDLPAFHGLGSLKKLVIAENAGLSPEALDRLGVLGALEKLNGRECGITRVPAAWAGLRSLRELDLSRNPLRSLPAVPFPALEKLHLGNTPVPAGDLLPFLAGCPKLTSLELSDADAQHDATVLEEIKARYPGLRVKVNPYARRDNPEPAEALATAAEAGRIDEVRRLLDAGVPVDARHDHKTPLHVAAANGWADIVSLLLDRGADIEAKEWLGCTPLLLACGAGLDLVQLLLDRGADLGVQDRFERGAVWHALEATDVGLAMWLLDRGAPTVGASPLAPAVKVRDRAVFERLLALGAATDDALHAAAVAGAAPVVRRLLAAGARVDTRGEYGYTPLHRAAERGALAVVEVLVAAGADIEAPANDGATPLCRAAFGGKVEVARRLVAFGAAVTDRVVDHARYGNEEVRAFLQEARGRAGS